MQSLVVASTSQSGMSHCLVSSWSSIGTSVHFDGSFISIDLAKSRYKVYSDRICLLTLEHYLASFLALWAFGPLAETIVTLVLDTLVITKWNWACNFLGSDSRALFSCTFWVLGYLQYLFREGKIFCSWIVACSARAWFSPFKLAVLVAWDFTDWVGLKFLRCTTAIILYWVASCFRSNYCERRPCVFNNVFVWTQLSIMVNFQIFEENIFQFFSLKRFLALVISFKMHDVFASCCCHVLYCVVTYFFAQLRGNFDVNLGSNRLLNIMSILVGGCLSCLLPRTCILSK